jgi:hypothetical protein
VLGQAIELEVGKEPIDIRKLALTARANAGLIVVDTPLATTRGGDDNGTYDNVPIIDLARNSPFLPGKKQNGVKQETVNDGGNNSDDNNNACLTFATGVKETAPVTEKTTTRTHGSVVDPALLC